MLDSDFWWTLLLVFTVCSISPTLTMCLYWADKLKHRRGGGIAPLALHFSCYALAGAMLIWLK